MERKVCTIGEWLDVWNMPRKRSKSTEMPEKGYRGISRKSKAHHSQSCCRSLTAHLPVHFKVRRNSPRIAAHATPYLRDPND